MLLCLCGGLLLGACVASRLVAPAKPKRSQKLGDPSYDIQLIATPAASGVMLKVLTWLLADSPLGPLIRRFLLNDEKNGSALMQDLAAQACKTPGNYALFHPLHRLSPQEQQRHIQAAQKSEQLQHGFGEVPKSPFVTVEDFARAYRQGDWTPSQVAERLLKSIDELQPKFKPFVTVLKEEVLAQAMESDRRFQTKQPRSIFEGVPVAVKDMFRVKGHLMTEGSIWPADDEHNLPGEKDNQVVKLFREAGAVIVGTTAMTEFGVTPLGYSAHHRGPFNAYDPKHYPLGSSSGSAVAVALGLVPVALGADAGGSIRLPASAQGVFGLATTYGRVPDDSSNVNMGTMQKSGPIAATARDAALAYLVMSQPVKGNFYDQLYGDPSLPPPHLEDFGNSNLKGLRLGIFWDYFNDAEPDIVKSCKQAVDLLQSMGVEIVPIAIPHLRSLQVSHGLVVSVELTSILAKVYETEPSTQIQLALGSSIAGVEFHSGQVLRGWASQHIRELFEKEQLCGIVTPTIGLTPPEIPKGARATGESNTPLLLQLMKYIFLGNLCGFPGITIPVNYDHIPVGLHILGNHWSEAKLLRLAAALEQRFQRRTPQSFIDLLA